MGPEICSKMVDQRFTCQVSEKLGAKRPSAMLGYSLVRNAHLDVASFRLFELEANPVNSKSLQQIGKKKKKGRQKKKQTNKQKSKSLKM